MDALMVVLVIIVGIGALMVGAVGLVALYLAWWAIIPLVGLCVGGGFGFLFGLGVGGIVGIVVLTFKKF